MLQTLIFCLIGAFIGISQSAGIGGGPVINLCLMLGLGYSSRVATALTYIFLMGGSCSAYLQNMKKKRPDGTLLIDYQLVVLTLPMIMTGSLFGSILRRFLSYFFITIIFTVLLIYLTITSYQGYKRVVSSETVPYPTSPLRDGLIYSQAVDLHPILTSSLQQNKYVFQKDKMKIVLYTIIYTVAILLIRGGLKYQSIIGLEACGIGFWVCNALHLIISLLLTKSIAIQQFKMQNYQIKFGLEIRYSMRMNDVKMRETSFYGFLAGTLGGAIGLGGAIILVPIWLKVGYHRDVAAASTSPLIFCSAFCSFLVSAFSGRYTWLIFIEFFSLSFFSSWVVKSFITWISNRFHLKAVGYMLLIITMVSSLLALLPYEISSYIRSPYEFMTFGILC